MQSNQKRPNTTSLLLILYPSHLFTLQQPAVQSSSATTFRFSSLSALARQSLTIKASFSYHHMLASPHCSMAKKREIVLFLTEEIFRSRKCFEKMSLIFY